MCSWFWFKHILFSTQKRIGCDLKCDITFSIIVLIQLLVVQVDLKSSGKTALHMSAHQGHVDIVRLLLAAGANLELQDEDGDTALHYSALG